MTQFFYDLVPPWPGDGGLGVNRRPDRGRRRPVANDVRRHPLMRLIYANNAGEGMSLDIHTPVAAPEIDVVVIPIGPARDSESASARAWAAAELWRRYPHARVMLAVESATDATANPTSSVRGILDTAGVPSDRVDEVSSGSGLRSLARQVRESTGERLVGITGQLTSLQRGLALLSATGAPAIGVLASDPRPWWRRLFLHICESFLRPVLFLTILTTRPTRIEER